MAKFGAGRQAPFSIYIADPGDSRASFYTTAPTKAAARRMKATLKTRHPDRRVWVVSARP